MNGRETSFGGLTGLLRRAKWLLSAILALFATCLFSGAASAQSSFSYGNSTDATFDENTHPCTSPLTRTISVTDSFTVGDLNVGILLAHSYRGDLIITLTPPSGSGGSPVILFNQTGGTRNNLNILLDDANANPIGNHTGNNDTATNTTGAPPWEETTYYPNAPLSAFNGLQANGNWTLSICDNAGGDSGEFFQANLYFTSAAPPPTNYADLSLTQTVSNTTPAFADTITYTLTLTNASGSPSTANGITVQDTLPAGVTFVSSSGTGSYSSGTGVWTVGSLAPGGVATLNIIVTVSATSGTVTNIAQVTASSVADLDSTPNNGVTTEDDYASRTFTVSARIAGTPPTLTCPVGTTVFDWDGRTWNAGSLSNSYALTNVGTFDIDISTSTAFVAGSPALNSNLTGGLSPVQNSLFLNMNNTLRSDVSTTVIDLPTAVPGLQFRLHDVDFNATSFADKVTVTGTFNGTAVTPTLTNGVSNYVIGNVAIGDTGAGDTTAVGNVVVTFLSPVDKVTVVYGNHTTAPADPGNQWMSIHDISFCNPQATLNVSKISTVLADGVSGSNPKAIPGSTIRYCITIANAGSATTTNVTATDTIPGDVTYDLNSMASGATCGTATTPEDDDASDAGETDPFRMSISGTTITGTAASLAPNASFAMVFNAKVD
jgi:uncharacterized repeat protein (TIGR01451 family)